MINIDSLPKSIEYNGNIYFLHLGVTAFNKIVICYQYAFSPREAIEKKIEYNVLSQVVEPDMSDNIVSSNEVTDIVDVPTTEIGFEILQTRLKNAIESNIVELYK